MNSVFKPTDDEIGNYIKSVVSKMCDISSSEIKAQEKLTELGLDSLHTVDLILALEAHFNIFFDDSDLDFEQLKTIEDYQILVRHQLAGM